MTDNYAHVNDPDTNDADEQAMLHRLQQAFMMRYPVPDATAAWHRVLASQTTQRADVHVGASDLQHLPHLVVTSPSATQYPALTRSQARSQPSTRVPWRSVLGIVALAAVAVVGLLGSLRGIVAWPTMPPQTSNLPATMPAVSSAVQDVLAFDPALLVKQLGAGWNLSSTWASVAEVGASDFTGFLGSTRLVLRGPDEALIIVDVRPVAADFFSMDAAWAWTNSDALMEQGRLVAAGSKESARVQGCRQALHMEGIRKADRTAVGGITLCAVASSEIVLVTTSGAVLGTEGWAASDQVAAAVAATLADATIVPTHRYEGPNTPERGLYQSPLINAPLTQALTWGTLLRWTGEAAVSPDPDSETPWLKMRSTEGMEGWVPGDLLSPAVEGEVLGVFPIPTQTNE